MFAPYTREAIAPMSPTLKEDLIKGTGTTAPVTGRKKETINTKAQGARGPPPQLPLLMTVVQVMAALGVSRRSVYSFIAGGRLHPMRLGRRMVRFKTAEVLQLADSEFAPLHVPQLKNQKTEEPA
jgi:excisionase family DNA binding protein